MHNPDEYKDLVKPLNDKSRKTIQVGKLTLVPHKFTEAGDIPRSSQDVVLSKLNLADLRFLQAWRSNKWNDAETLKALNLTADQADKTFKKLAYFKTEDARIKALASEATPERVLAKDMENIESGVLNDSQHKSLDRIAKAQGMFKTSESGGNTINIFNLPKISPEAEAALRSLADKEADVIDAEVA